MSALCSDQLGDKKELNKGDEVITCAMGFPTTINWHYTKWFSTCFLKFSFSNYNLNENILEKHIKKNKGIFITPHFSNPFNIDKIKKFADKV